MPDDVKAVKLTAKRLASLTADEHEFIAEMAHEPGTGWANFDPPFLRRYVSRLESWGWLESEGRGRDARHRWTVVGAAALASAHPAAARR